MRPSAFSNGQIFGALGLSCLVQVPLVVLVALAHAGPGFEPPALPPREMAIAINPILDLPLLKKGGKPRPNKLPDMWKPPQQVKRYEQKAVPSTAAKKTVDAIPEVEAAKKPEEVPPPDAPVAKSVDEMIQKMKAEREEEEPNVPEEGASDGIEGGTETDPLKARAINLYERKLAEWLRQGFDPPVDELGCATLAPLRANVNARISAEGTVSGYDITSSGNDVFDGRVRRAMDARVGQKVPPPPPNYPDILDAVVRSVFLGKNEKCK